MSTPMNLYQSLWQVQISTSLPESFSPFATTTTIKNDDDQNVIKEKIEKSKSLLLFRAHHILADGVSLGTSLIDLCDERDELYEEFIKQYQKYKNKMKQKYDKMSALQKLFSKLIKLLQFALASMNAIVY